MLYTEKSVPVIMAYALRAKLHVILSPSLIDGLYTGSDLEVSFFKVNNNHGRLALHLSKQGVVALSLKKTRVYSYQLFQNSKKPQVVNIF